MEGKYNNQDARKARELTRTITRRFGDPNMGQEYKDPYTRGPFAVNATVFSAKPNSQGLSR